MTPLDHRHTRRKFILGAAGAAAAGALPALLARSRAFADSQTPNAIVAENRQTDPNTWSRGFQLAGTPNQGIVGFPTQTSVNVGQDVTVLAAQYFGTASLATTIELYRLGYYGGRGGRLVWSNAVTTTDQVAQPTGVWEAQFGRRTCAGWTNPLTIPGAKLAVTGVYMVKLITASGTNFFPLIVRDDANAHDLRVLLPVNTWAAYNDWPGNQSPGADPTQYSESLYTSTSFGPTIPTTATTRASKVSFDRPMINGASTYDFALRTEFPLIYWLERQGYDVAYSDDLDLHFHPEHLTKPATKTLVIAGHAEYWTSQMRANVAAARDAGTNLVSLSANTSYWQVRYEKGDLSAAAATRTEARTLVCFKTVEGSGAAGTGTVATNDFGPGNTSEGAALSALGSDKAVGGTGTAADRPDLATTTARDPGALAGDAQAPGDDAHGHGRVGPAAPENSLWGVLYVGDDDNKMYPLEVPSSAPGTGELTDHRAWRHTTVAGSGSAATIGSNLVGWEWDAIPAGGIYTMGGASISAHQPAGVKRVTESDPGSHSPSVAVSYLTDYGRTRSASPAPGQGSKVHAVTYTAPSGALVFASGTMQWSWGLGPHFGRDTQPGFYDEAATDDSDPRIQQATYNILADGGVKPTTPEGITLDPVAPPAPPPPPAQTTTVTTTTTTTTTVTTPPPPPDTTPPVFTLTPLTVTVTSAGLIWLHIACPVSEARGAFGTLTLATANPVRVSARKRKRRVTLGSPFFQVLGGHTVTVSIALSKANRDLLAWLGRVRLTATIRAEDGAGNRNTQAITVMLVPHRWPARHH